MSDLAVVTQRRAPGERHDDETVEVALTEVALCGGSTALASKRLAERGILVKKSVMDNWKLRYPERYAQIRDQRAAEIQRLVAAAHEDLALKAAALTAKVLERTEKELDEIPARDLAGALRNVATTGGISVDKLTVARERPLNGAPASRDVNEIVRALEGMKVVQVTGLPVMGLPTPVDAEVVSEEGAV
jgi:hypothetical protein